MSWLGNTREKTTDSAKKFGRKKYLFQKLLAVINRSSHEVSASFCEVLKFNIDELKYTSEVRYDNIVKHPGHKDYFFASKNNKIGVINIKTGEVIHEPIFERVYNKIHLLILEDQMKM